MLTSGLDETWLLLFGSSSLSALGLTSVDVTRKKISIRNTMSDIDDILKLDSTFARRFSAIVFLIIYLQVRGADP